MIFFNLASRKNFPSPGTARAQPAYFKTIMFTDLNLALRQLLK